MVNVLAIDILTGNVVVLSGDFIKDSFTMFPESNPELKYQVTISPAGEFIKTPLFNVICTIGPLYSYLDGLNARFVWHSTEEENLHHYILERTNANQGGVDKTMVISATGSGSDYAALDDELFEDPSTYSYILYAVFTTQVQVPIAYPGGLMPLIASIAHFSATDSGGDARFYWEATAEIGVTHYRLDRYNNLLLAIDKTTNIPTPGPAGTYEVFDDEITESYIVYSWTLTAVFVDDTEDELVTNAVIV